MTIVQYLNCLFAAAVAGWFIHDHKYGWAVFLVLGVFVGIADSIVTAIRNHK